MNRTKKRSKIIYILAIMSIMVIGIQKINAVGIEDYTKYSDSESASTISQGSYNGIYGIRLSVIDKDGNNIVKSDFIRIDLNEWSTENGTPIYYNKHFYTSYNKCTKIEHNMGTCNVNEEYASCVSFESSFDSRTMYEGCMYYGIPRFVQGVDGTSIETWITGENYKNLKAMLLAAGYKCLKDPSDSMCVNANDHYVTLEALYNQSRFIGTGYELANKGGTEPCDGTRVGLLCSTATKTATFNMHKTLSNTEALFNLTTNRTVNPSWDTAANELKNPKNRAGVALYKIGDIIPTRKLIIKKVKKGTHQTITSDSAEFILYNGSNCNQGSEYEPNNKIETTRGGIITYKNLPFGNYSIKEVKAPEGYLLNETCVNFTFNKNYLELEIENEIEKECVERFNLLTNKNDIVTRYKIYIDTESKYNNLLNLSIDKASEACSYTACKYPDNYGCLYGNLSMEYDYNATGSTRLSIPKENVGYACYTSTINGIDNNIIGICNTAFEFTNPMEANNPGFKFEAIRGQKFTAPSYPIGFTQAGTGVLTKKCISIDGNNISIPNNFENEYKDMVTSVKLNYEVSKGKFVNVVDDNSTITSEIITNNSNEIEYRISSDYLFKKSYYDIGSNSKFSFKPFYPSHETEYFMSSSGDPISDNQEGLIEFGFTINYKINNEANQLSKSSKICKYELNSELITKQTPLNIEFRVIDIKNPFPGKSGNNDRMIGSNWRGYAFSKLPKDIVGIKYSNKDQMDVNKELLKKGFYSKFGIFDNSIDCENKELGIVSKLTCKSLTNGIITNDYSYRNYYIKNAVNSYGRDGSGKSVTPKYTITLTPSTIKNIRKYNATTTYDDFRSACSYGNADCNIEENKFHMWFLQQYKKNKVISCKDAKCFEA